MNGLFRDRKLHFLKDSDSERVILKTTGEKKNLCVLGSQCLRPHWNTYLGSYWPELIVTEQIYLSFVWLTAEMQSLVPINCKAQHSKEEHPHRAEEEGVELADHSWRFNLLVLEGDKMSWKRNIWKGDFEGYFYDHIKKYFEILKSEKL